MLGKYSDNKWLRSDGDDREWPVAYHGTLEMNAEGIVKKQKLNLVKFLGKKFGEYFPLEFILEKWSEKRSQSICYD